MARWAPARTDVIAEYAAEVLEVFPEGRVLVGLDGVDGVGRTTFAADLAGALTATGVAAAAISLDDFLVPPDRRGQLRDGRAWYASAHDLDAFRRLVVQPYRRGDGVPVRNRDEGGRVLLDPPVFHPEERSALVVEGSFLHRKELRPVWHTSAWLHAPRSLARERAATRDGVPVDDPGLQREFDAVELYFREVDPRKLANASFDLTDPAHPRRIFADAC